MFQERGVHVLIRLNLPLPSSTFLFCIGLCIWKLGRKYSTVKSTDLLGLEGHVCCPEAVCVLSVICFKMKRNCNCFFYQSLVLQTVHTFSLRKTETYWAVTETEQSNGVATCRSHQWLIHPSLFSLSHTHSPSSDLPQANIIFIFKIYGLTLVLLWIYNPLLLKKIIILYCRPLCSHHKWLNNTMLVWTNHFLYGHIVIFWWHSSIKKRVTHFMWAVLTWLEVAETSG